MDYDRVYEDELLYYAEKGEDVSLTLTYVYSTSDGELKTKEIVTSETAGVAGIDSIYFDFYEVWLDVGGEDGAILIAYSARSGKDVSLTTYGQRHPIWFVAFIMRSIFGRCLLFMARPPRR